MQYGPQLIVHGLSVSYFTRKVTGYLDYKGIPWRLRPSIGAYPRGACRGLERRHPDAHHARGRDRLGLDRGDPAPRDPLPGARRAAAGSGAGLPRLPRRGLLRRVALPARGRHALALPGERRLRQLGHRARGQPRDPRSDRRHARPGHRGDDGLPAAARHHSREHRRLGRRLAAALAARARGARRGVRLRAGRTAVARRLRALRRQRRALRERSGVPAPHRPGGAGGHRAHPRAVDAARPYVRRVARHRPRARDAARPAARGGPPLSPLGRRGDADRLGDGALRGRQRGAHREHELPRRGARRAAGPLRRGTLREARRVLDEAGVLPHFADHLDQATAIPDPRALPRPADNQPFRAGA